MLRQTDKHFTVMLPWHSLFRIYARDQSYRHLVAIRQLHNYIRDLPRIALRTSLEASQ